MEKSHTNCISGIVCDAIKCTYNDSKKCTASHIVVGSSDASTSRETECNTFRQR